MREKRQWKQEDVNSGKDGIVSLRYSLIRERFSEKQVKSVGVCCKALLSRVIVFEKKKPSQLPSEKSNRQQRTNYLLLQHEHLQSVRKRWLVGSQVKIVPFPEVFWAKLHLYWNLISLTRVYRYQQVFVVKSLLTSRTIALSTLRRLQELKNNSSRDQKHLIPVFSMTMSTKVRSRNRSKMFWLRVVSF